MDFFSFYEKVQKRAEASAAPPVPSAQPQKDILTISELTRQIESALRDCLPPQLLIKGEVSNFKRHAQSGHLYFTLKDEQSCIDCAMWKAEAQRLRFELEDGMELLATGRVGIYGQRGKYQFYTTRLEPLGQGALEVAFRQLQNRLHALGLFDQERKKRIPPYPLRIVLMTSTATAALQDMLKVLRRFSWLSVLVCHVPVQGEGSAERMAAAIAELNRGNRHLRIDVILLGRGGGSLEDLWEFNKEILAKAIAASAIPIVTGIGHEIDVTIADLVADHHAHTPTEAAQVITAQWRGVSETLQAVALRLSREMGLVLENARQRLTQVQRHECFRRPKDRIHQARQLLDERQRALEWAMNGCLRDVKDRLLELARRVERHRPAALIERMRVRLGGMEHRLATVGAICLREKRQRLATITSRLGQSHPRHLARLSSTRVEGLRLRLMRGVAELLHLRRLRLAAIATHLNAVGPEQVLRRGYTITTFKRGTAVVRSAAQVRAGDKLVTRFADGAVESSVQDMKQLSLWD